MFEEEAEEWVKTKGTDAMTCLKENIGWDDVCKQAFKDGAEFGYNKANEWHDLRKNPNDLPNNKRSVWCYYGDGCGKGFYDKDDGGWWIEGHIYCSVINAWKELPEVPKENE